MELAVQGNDIVLRGVTDFYLPHIFECGQCFRWNRQENGEYIGVAGGRVLRLGQRGAEVVLYDTTRQAYDEFWKQYLHLDYDYGTVKQTLSSDPVLSMAAESGYGIRILRQQPWECTVSFIISASNNIPRIKKIIDALCANFGEHIVYQGKEYYTFPSPERIASLNLEELAVIRAGFRDKYILDAARKTADGELDFTELEKAETQKARDMLMRVSGIGRKVADCILLFGCGRHEVFPVDVWIKRIMEYYYFENQQNIKNIAETANEKFGTLSGFAQQYLFYYARENKLTKE